MDRHRVRQCAPQAWLHTDEEAHTAHLRGVLVEGEQVGERDDG